MGLERAVRRDDAAAAGPGGLFLVVRAPQALIHDRKGGEMRLSRFALAGVATAVLLAVPFGVAHAGGPVPTVTVNAPPASNIRNVTLKLPTTDPTGTGIKAWFLSESPTTPALNATGWKTDKPAAFKVSAGDGEKTIYAWVKSNNNQRSARAEDTVILDTVAPTADLSAPDETETRTIPVDFDFDDGGTPPSGVTSWAIVNGTGVPAPSAPAWKTAPHSTFKLSLGNGTKTITAFTRDAAGNVSAGSTTTVEMTLGDPTLTLSIPPKTASRTVTVTVSTTDPAGTGIAGYFLSESPTKPSVSAAGWMVFPATFKFTAAQGTKVLYGWVKDNNNQVSARVQDETILDMTAPTVELTAPTSTTTQTIAVTLTGEDPVPAEGTSTGITHWAVVNGTTVPTPGAPAWKTTPPTSLKLTAGDGAKTISAFSRDAVGNVSLADTKTVNKTLAAPVLTFNIVPAYSKSLTVSVSLNATDPGGTGIAGYRMSESSATPSPTGPGWPVLPTSFLLSNTQGEHTVYAWAKDNNGSLSLAKSDTVVYDSIKPSASMTAQAAYNTLSFTVTMSGDALGGSPIAHYALVTGSTEPGQHAAAWKTSAPTSVTVSGADGAKTISAWVRDAAGNVSLAAILVPTLDRVKPTATIDAPATTSVREIVVNVGGTDAGGSGVTHHIVVEGTTAPAVGDPAWQAGSALDFQLSAGDGVKTISAFTKDAAGNVSLAATTTVELTEQS
jgi:hypothetical protein